MPPNKIYVDSRFRKDTGGGNSDAQFSIELPHPIIVKGRAIIDTCLIPNSFYTIRAGENQKVFVREVVGATTTFRIVSIAEGQYTAYSLKDALLTALQTGKSIPGNYTVSYDPVTNKLSIGTLDTSASFTIYPRPC